MGTLVGGRTLYGHALGVLMLDTRFPRLPGDVGNAITWAFPVLYRIVEGADTTRIMRPEPDPDLLDPFIEAARTLESNGVLAITTSCGFLAVFQRELAASVSVPMLTSALLQVPLAAQLIGSDRRVGILTERPDLTDRHFGGAGWTTGEVPVIVKALPYGAEFPAVYIDGKTETDPSILERELVTSATELVEEHPEVGAIVLECTNFVPFSQTIRRATRRPIFDLYTLVMQTYEATRGVSFSSSL